jgi:hypothetical protein
LLVYPLDTDKKSAYDKPVFDEDEQAIDLVDCAVELVTDRNHRDFGVLSLKFSAISRQRCAFSRPLAAVVYV